MARTCQLCERLLGKWRRWHEFPRPEPDGCQCCGGGLELQEAGECRSGLLEACSDVRWDNTLSAVLPVIEPMADWTAPVAESM